MNSTTQHRKQVIEQEKTSLKPIVTSGMARAEEEPEKA
jgi:hypothetical protein